MTWVSVVSFGVLANRRGLPPCRCSLPGVADDALTSLTNKKTAVQRQLPSQPDLLAQVLAQTSQVSQSPIISNSRRPIVNLQAQGVPRVTPCETTQNALRQPGTVIPGYGLSLDNWQHLGTPTRGL